MEFKKILVINCGSSSLKYQLFNMPEGENVIKGNVERIGTDGAFLKQKRTKDKKEFLLESANAEGGIVDHKTAIKHVIAALTNKDSGVLSNLSEIDIVSHRVVQGGDKYNDTVVVDKKVIKDIEDLSDLAPLHNPANLEGIKAAMEALPGVPQTVTFDTAFHQTMPAEAYMYAIPYELYEKYGLRKYGFHGTSHKYVSEKAIELCKRSPANTNVVSCHLGNGASITAIQKGKSIDTSMGLTPLEGLVMGTRSGDIDPAIIPYLYNKGYSIDEVNTILNKKSGLLGLTEKTNDMRDVKEDALAGDERAQLALNIFTRRVKKYIGSYFASMVKVDILIFTGGIGENSWEIREWICENLENLGIHLDKEKNKKVGGSQGIISTDFSPVTIVVLPTNEEIQIAKEGYKVLNSH